MNMCTKKALAALLFVGTAGAMEQEMQDMTGELNQPYVAGVNEGDRMDIQRRFNLSDVQAEKTELCTQIKNLLTADTTLTVFVGTAIQIETRRQYVKRCLENGIESQQLVHYFAKNIGQSFSSLWNKLFEKYFAFLNNLEQESLRASQGTSLLTRDQLLIRVNIVLELSTNLNQLNCVSIQPLIERAENQMQIIFNNLQ